MKIKYLLVAVAMIGLTSFSNANLEEIIKSSKQIVQNSNFRRREINS
jgi:hypothetical protein